MPAMGRVGEVCEPTCSESSTPTVRQDTFLRPFETANATSRSTNRPTKPRKASMGGQVPETGPDTPVEPRSRQALTCGNTVPTELFPEAVAWWLTPAYCHHYI